MSVGLFKSWNSNFTTFSSGILAIGIYLEGEAKGLEKVVKIINLDGPYGDHNPFWESLKAQWVLIGNNVILGDDLNINLSPRELWGDLARQDP